MRFVLIVTIASVAACSANSISTTVGEEPTVQKPADTTASTEEETPQIDANAQAIIDLFRIMNDERRSPTEFYSESATFGVAYSVMAPEAMPIAKMQEWDKDTWAMSSDMKIRPLRIIDIGEKTYLVETYMTGTFDGELQSPNGPIPPTNERLGLSMLWVYTFDDDGKVQNVKIWRNELGMMVDLGVMPSPMGEPSVDPPMPAGETVVQKVEAKTNQELVDWYEEFEGSIHARPWSREATAAMIHDDVEIGLPVRSDVDKERWMQSFEMFAAGLSEMSLEIQRAWTVGDLLIVEATGKAKHTGKLGPFEATNKTIENPWLDFLTVRDGKVVKFHGYNNPLYSMKQLGLFPPPKADEAAAR